MLRKCSLIRLLLNTRVCRVGSSCFETFGDHYCNVIMGAMESQITSLASVYSTIHSGADQRKHQSSASLAFGWEIHQWLVNSPHKYTVTRKCFHLMTSSYQLKTNHQATAIVGEAVGLIFKNLLQFLTIRSNKVYKSTLMQMRVIRRLWDKIK